MNVEAILDSDGPCLSSALAKKLVAMGLSAEAARQRTSRAGGHVKRLRGLSLPNRERFLFVQGQFGSPEFKTKLAAAFETTGSAYGRSIAGLRARGGTMLVSHFPIASGLPISNAKGQLLHDLVETKLMELGLIYRILSGDDEVVTLWDSDGLSSRRRAVMITDELLLSSV